MNFDSDAPLGQQFLASPYQYLQAFVRNMNNQIFLSQYQINNLYILLLIGKTSPWDTLKPNTFHTKQKIDQIITKKVAEVKIILQNLSQVYEDKVKRNTFNQIERLMNIIKAKNKSIFIQKNMQACSCEHHTSSCKNTQNDLKEKIQKDEINFNSSQNQKSQISLQNTDKIQKDKVQIIAYQQFNESFKTQNQKQKQKYGEQNNLSKEKQNNQQILQVNSPLQQSQQHHNHNHVNHHIEDQREVMGIFYGLANIPNLSTLALGNCLQYSSAERFIKFKMSKNYIMTIKNQDQLNFDLTSQLSKLPSQTFSHHIFPFLTANQLFKMRGVCKQWMDNVKQAWHSTFKRQMYAQLLACQYCKEIQFYYKLIQLRNPFFQKISLLMHALLQIIQWDKIYQQIQSNTIIPQLKKVLIILLKLIGEPIQLTNLNSITQQVWNTYKEKTLALKQKITIFFSDITSACLSINQLKQIKINLLDDPFMRLQQVQSEDKTPLLLVIFIKQLTLQQLIRNHIYFSQEYLMNTKRRLDSVSSKMPQQKGFLQGVYKILLLRTMNPFTKEEGQDEKSQMPNFQQLLYSIFDNSEVSKPDFVIKNRSSCTNIYLDKATKLDIIVSTVKKMKVFQDQPIRRVKRTYYNLNGEEGKTIIYDENGNEKQIIYPETNNQSENFEQKNQQTQKNANEFSQSSRQYQKKPSSQTQNKRSKQLSTVKLYEINLNNNKSTQIGINTEQIEQKKQEQKKKEEQSAN